MVEWQFEFRSALFDQTPASGWQDNADLLVPTFFNPDTDRWRVAIQSWVIEVDGLSPSSWTPEPGNGRQRPHMPPLDHLDTGFLDDVRAAGFDYNDVDVVINTHIHSDHVGWNTKLENGAWVPTFPNARYLMPAPDYRFFHPWDRPAAKSVPRTEHEPKRRDGTRFVFEDSVIPVEVAGQIVQWSQDYRGQRFAAAACGRGTHPRLLGAVAGRGPAGSVRRGPYPQPHSATSTRGRLCVRRGPDCSRGDP